MMDETVVLELTGAAVVDALENGVAMYPKLEGRFLQVCRYYTPSECLRLRLSI